MSIKETKKMSSRRLIALILSVGLHAVLIYFIGRAALDYVLPEGEITSSEMTFETPQGDSTDVDVVETTPEPIPEPVAPAPPPPPPKPKPTEVKPAEKIRTPPKAEAPPAEPAEIPAPEDIPVPVSETPPEVEDVQGEEPESAPTPIPPEPIQKSAPEPVAAAPTPEPVPTTAAATPADTSALADTAAQSPGPSGPVQSDSVLIPFGTNKPLTYPMMGRLKKLEGVSVLHYTVNEAGAVTNIRIAQSSGHAVLDNQAVETIKTWKFRPTGRVGVYERPIRWAIKGEAEAAPSQLRRGK